MTCVYVHISLLSDLDVRHDIKVSDAIVVRHLGDVINRDN